MSLISLMAFNSSSILASHSAYNMMSVSNARLGMLSSSIMRNPSFGSLRTLALLDTMCEQKMLTNSLQYKMSRAIIEQQEDQKKKDSKKFNVFA